MGLKFLNYEFQMLCVMNCEKLTNAWVINSVIDICIFQVSITVFKDFSRPFHTYDHFQGFSRR